MKIIVYCQHVLGVGHFFRTLEIVKALYDHEIILVTGGDTLPQGVPDHVRQVNLPGLMMDKAFNFIYSVDPEKKVEDVKGERQRLLEELFIKEKPDLFLVELYPFGRKAFRFELDPVLAFIKEQKGIKCKVICSLRDILVEKKDPATHEKRVVKILNNYFDGLLIHSDPEMIRLDSSFSRVKDILIPIFYTGFVTPLPDPGKVSGIKSALGVKSDESLVVASVGGGSVGARLLRTAILAHGLLLNRDRVKMIVLTGPYMEKKEVDALVSLAGKNVRVETFWEDFISLLAASDLSISMAGYNTCMNLVAAGAPSLVWPFDENLEQGTRAEALADFADMEILSEKSLVPEVLAGIIKERLVSEKKEIAKTLDLGGAVAVSNWIKETGTP